jgi:membrane-associated phospholipid phosphatase
VLETLLQLDTRLFTAINSGLANPLLDAVLPWWRNRFFWYPLYAGLLGWLLWRFRGRALPFVVLVAGAVMISDALSSHLIKPWVGRLRPCQAPELANSVRVLVTCGPAASFPSSHAVNHFCLALVLYRGLGWVSIWLLPLLLLWAASIAFGQVYVGVHYPLDALVGSALGLVAGWACSELYCRLRQQRWALERH